MSVTRRDLIKLGGLAALGAAAITIPLGASAQARRVSTLAPKDFPQRYVARIGKLPVRAPVMEGALATYDLTVKVDAGAQVLNGTLKTPVHGYDGMFPGPLIELERGTRATVRIRNHMPVAGPFGSTSNLSTHLHGSASLPQYDGYASDVTPVGSLKDYRYPNHQAARTLWYHDHGVHFTAKQAYGGLAAMYVLHDAVERALLPQGEFDVPLLVNDAMFGADGALTYDDNAHSGLWGDVIMVNGRPWPVMQVKRRTYRFRILNCSISRSYRWRLSNGADLQVVATDGGLMPKGVAVTTMRHGVAERYEVVIDFGKMPAGTTRVELLNDSTENNRDYDFTNKVMAFDLVDDGFDLGDRTWDMRFADKPLAASPVMDDALLSRVKDLKRRHFRIKKTGEVWTINGKSWTDVVGSGFRDVLADPKAGAFEVWEFENSSGGWHHPLHIHLADFRIIKRRGGVNRVLPHEQGPKDVVYVGESETVTLLVHFQVSPETVTADPTTSGGTYMFHCHNLPHEDHDMMHQFRVGGGEAVAAHNHPIDAARPAPDPTYRSV